MTDQTLAPCPLCNGSAEIDTMQFFRHYKTGEPLDKVAVYCTQCGLSMSEYPGDLGLSREETTEIVIAAWNKRAPATPPPDAEQHQVRPSEHQVRPPDAELDALCMRVFERVGEISTPMMGGAGFAAVLCSYFENPDRAGGGEHGWSDNANAGCKEVIAALRALAHERNEDAE